MPPKNDIFFITAFTERECILISPPSMGRELASVLSLIFHSASWVFSTVKLQGEEIYLALYRGCDWKREMLGARTPSKHIHIHTEQY